MADKKVRWIAGDRKLPYKGDIRTGDVLELPQEEAARYIKDGLVEEVTSTPELQED